MKLSLPTRGPEPLIRLSIRVKDGLKLDSSQEEIVAHIVTGLTGDQGGSSEIGRD